LHFDRSTRTVLDMDLDELRAFIAVVETGSFSGAAKSLNFARATLRRRVDELESRSGVQLLKRATDGATVTKAGELVAQRGRAILGETKALLSAARALDSQTGQITLEVPLGQPPEFERTAHLTLRKAAPSLRWRIQYTHGKFNEDSEALLVIHVGTPPFSDTDEWEHIRLAKVPVQLLATREYLDKRGTPQDAEELSEHAILMWERHDRSPNHLPLEGEKPLELEPTLISPAPYMIRSFASAHDGIAFAPNAKIPPFLVSDDGLIPVLPDVVRDEAQFWLSTKRNNEAGPFGVLIKAVTKFTSGALGGWS